MDYKQIDEHSAVIRTLKENDIKIKPKGYSMYPLFVPGRDYAVITHIEPDKLKKGDASSLRRSYKSLFSIYSTLLKMEAFSASIFI